MSVDVGWVAAFAEREAPRLLSYFERRVVVREDAADLLGETLLVLWRRSSDIPASDIEAAMWLFGVARRVLAGHRRGGKRRLALAERLRNELAVTSDMTDEVADRVREAVRALPERDRELVGLVHWEGFALAEAAAILGIRPGTARMRYQRARARLAETLSLSRSAEERETREPAHGRGG
jgi:RNA polymerase sigma-70 factor (ECF subfamily)